jgi:alpha-glucosidase
VRCKSKGKNTSWGFQLFCKLQQLSCFSLQAQFHFAFHFNQAALHQKKYSSATKTPLFNYLYSMKRLTVFTIFLIHLFFQSITAQVTLRLTSIPANTPNNAAIYFASNINAWNPGDVNYTLAIVNGTYQIVIPEGTGTVEFKFTRGLWASVEGGPNCEEIANRTFTFTGSPQTINLTVQKWKDLCSSTAAPNVQILNNAFVMPQLNNRTRRIWLYLPPDYQTTSKQYPVLYMHDGQNLFDAATSFAGEWQVDETLNALHASGNYGAIVVGIDNGGVSRINEYSPWNNPQYGGGEGASYIDFIAQTLKPFIDANYRTLTEPQYTCLFGSSLGGLISTYGAVRYPNVFGRVGSFSPAYWFVFTELNNYISTSTTNISNLRISHVAGQNESATMAPHINTVTSNLFARGLLNSNSSIKTDADGTHTEAYWRREFGAAYQWLFPNTPTSVRSFSVTVNKIRIVPNPVQDYFQIAEYKVKPNDVISLVSSQGTIVKAWKGNFSSNYVINDVRAGVYTILINGTKAGRLVKK